MSVNFNSLQLHAGTYAKAGGRGVYPILCRDGKWAVGKPCPKAANASYGVWSRRQGLYYLVDEQAGEIGAWQCRQNQWVKLASTPSQGDQPCHLALSRDEGWLAVANYGSGSMALFRLGPGSRSLTGPTAVRQNEGSGKVRERQEGPHAHATAFSQDGHWLFQTDLGTDEVLAFAFDPERGLTGERRLAYQAPPGSGPRHLIFHPVKPLAFLISELAATLTVFGVEGSQLVQRQLISTLPHAAAPGNLGGHVMLNAAGDRLYATNRGHDSIATFEVSHDGQLTFLGDVPSGGASPRFFLLLEEARLMIVANEEGNCVTIFEVGPDGLLTQSGSAAIPGPAFIFQTNPLTNNE